MEQTLKERTAINPMVFRTTKYLAEKTKELAQREMVSQSAICRRALAQYLRADIERNSYAELSGY